MSFIVKDEGKNFPKIERPEDGTYQAVCYGVHDIGKQKKVFQGNEKIVHQCVICWEIDKKIEAEGDYKGKRYVISKKYTVSLFEKSNLRKDLESWRGKVFTKDELSGFDLESVIGANCLLNLATKTSGEKSYQNVTAVMALPKNMEKMTPENEKEPAKWIKDLQENCIKDSNNEVKGKISDAAKTVKKNFSNADVDIDDGDFFSAEEDEPTEGFNV